MKKKVDADIKRDGWGQQEFGGLITNANVYNKKMCDRVIIIKQNICQEVKVLTNGLSTC